MAKVKSGSMGANIKQDRAPKKTSDGCSKNSRPSSKNDKRMKKAYRGQGH